MANYKAILTRGAGVITMTVKTELRGDRVLELDVAKIQALPEFTADEEKIWYPLEDAAKVSQRVEFEVTTEDSITLLRLKNRSEGVKKEKIVVSQTEAKSLKTVVQNIESKQRGSASQDATYAEQRIVRLEQTVEASNREYVMLTYDIPTHKNAECPNPSRILWRHGFRANKSVWIMPKAQLEAWEVKELLALWNSHKLRVHIVEYAESQRSVIRAIAREMLEEEIRRQHTSLIENIASADKALVEALKQQDLTEKQQELIDAKRDNAVRAILRKASEDLDNAIRCAELFDETENVDELLVALRSTWNSWRASFDATQIQKGRRTV